MAFTITTKGLKELQQQMAKGDTCLEPDDVKVVLADALMLIKDAAYAKLQTARVGPQRAAREGWEHIADALTVQQGKSDRIATAFCKVFRKKAPQAIWVEFGHKIVGHKPGKKDIGKTVPPRPFFRPALDEQRKYVRRAIAKGLQSLIMRSGFPGFGTDETGWIG